MSGDNHLGSRFLPPKVDPRRLSDEQLAELADEINSVQALRLRRYMDTAPSDDSDALTMALIGLRGLLDSEAELCAARARSAERVMVGGGLSAILAGISLLIFHEAPFISLAPIAAGMYVAWRGHLTALDQVGRGSMCRRMVFVLDKLIG